MSKLPSIRNLIQTLPCRFVFVALCLRSSQGQHLRHGPVQIKQAGIVSMRTNMRNIVPKFSIMKFDSKPISANLSSSYSSSGGSTVASKTSSEGITSKVAIVIRLPTIIPERSGKDIQKSGKFTMI